MNESAWQAALQQGREDFGDLELATAFLLGTGLLQQKQRILEIGCGMGKLSSRLYDLGYRNITASDIALSALGAGKARFPHLALVCMDACALAFPDSTFDVCVSFDLAEHVPDIDAHLREVRRLLKPGGHYLLQTPNLLTNSVFETLRTRGLTWRRYHPSLQTAWGLRRRLSMAGFERIRFTKLPPLSDCKLQCIPACLRGIFTRIPWRRLPLGLQTNFYVVAVK